MYRSAHLEMQLLSLPLKPELGFETHFVKHLSRMFYPKQTKNKKNQEVEEINKFEQQKSTLMQ
jgi:hypothetical protein